MYSVQCIKANAFSIKYIPNILDVVYSSTTEKLEKVIGKYIKQITYHHHIRLPITIYLKMIFSRYNSL